MYIKDPVLRSLQGNSFDDFAGNVLEELSEQEMDIAAGLKSLSWLLGNKGYVCTLTVECMPSCN